MYQLHVGFFTGAKLGELFLAVFDLTRYDDFAAGFLSAANRLSLPGTIMQSILSYDRHLFRIINSGWSNGFFDWLMPWMRNSYLWYPLYLFLVLLVLTNFGKKAWVWVLFGAATAFLADFVSSGIIKEHVWRLRPCNNPDYASWIHILVGYRPQSSSFTSSHAANHFALATFLYMTLRPYFSKKWLSLLLIWAFLISFAQVYVGVHYPLDVTAGGLIGILIGYLPGYTFNRTVGLASSL